MNRLNFKALVLLALAVLPSSLFAQETIQHDLKVKLDPAAHRLVVEDRITIPGGSLHALRFFIHKDLTPTSPTPGVALIGKREDREVMPLESYQIVLPAGLKTFVLRYGGSIYHPLKSSGKEYARGFRQTPGLISQEGVYLSGKSHWYPNFDADWVTFKLLVELPAGWDAVSQGDRILHDRKENITRVQWLSRAPQDEIYLIAARFVEYVRPAGRISAMAFLRSRDDKLAERYLDATAQYVTMYEKLIGPYPYGKFALVENYWETGLGMPSFTLLGPKIIRFPFILHSSYPHEILHNWWGNSVYPEYEKGNWSEGLTAYLSDHLIKEQQGRGAAYRQETLQKYSDYVSDGRDFPLREFTSRRSVSSEAVGYGKSLMFFHMLRLEMGDDLFLKGLQHFYRHKRFRVASYNDLKKSFEKVTGNNLEKAFAQWVHRTGAPIIGLRDVRAEQVGSGFLLKAVLEQEQPGEAYSIPVPIAVTTEGQDHAFQTLAAMERRRQEIKIPLSARPLRLDIDPEFDLFRRLDRRETPPALTQAFGAKKVLIILPSSSSRKLLEGYRALAKSWAQSGPEAVETRLDTELEKLPRDRAVAVFGWESRLLDIVTAALKGYDVEIDQEGVRIKETVIQREDHSIVLTARHPDNGDLALTWVATDVVEAISGLARKLPHYHKYSYLGFEGAEPVNVVKGRWPVLDSPMTVFIPSEEGRISRVQRGKLAARAPLAPLPPVFSKGRMLETIRFLSSKELQGRGFGTGGLERAAEFIAGRFREFGLKPGGDSDASYFQTWEAQGGEPEQKGVLKNVIGFIPGSKPEWRNQSVVVGAHYDHLGFGWPDVREEHRGKIHPGADDNASGVAVLLELARVLGQTMRPGRNVVFAAFTGEEAGRRGSMSYVAKQTRFTVDQCIGMINLDTVGRLENRKLLVLGVDSAKEWGPILRGAGSVAGVEMETVSEELDSSDHKSFQDVGVPAVQLFSGPHPDYHRPSDAVEKIDPEGLVKVALVAKETLDYLAARAQPLTANESTGKAGGKTQGPLPSGRRQVSLGTVPDFSYRGEGYRLSGVVPGSPAESAGLREGDIVIRMGSKEIRSLGDLSSILKSLKPHDRITITFLREGRTKRVEVEVTRR